ncbi:MAG: arylsulfatase [Rubricoccaceae bacterium]
MVALASACTLPASTPARAGDPPNILYILADDLGYGELGSYGQSLIETPHLDALAATGMRFTQHYAGAPVCAPSRAVLLTGLHTGRVPIRGNDEWRERGEVWDYEAMFNDPTLEGQRPLPDSLVTVAEHLQAAGYTTGMVGKWGLGAPLSESIPTTQGFDYFLGYNCQRQAHTLYPMHLWHNEERVLLDNEMVAPRTKLADGADPTDPASYAPFTLNDYAPDVMHAGALEFIRQQDGPFFLYVASPLPHLPLQAPARWVDHYREKFGEEEPYIGDRGYFPAQYPRATYAAMISTLDEQVGELVAALKEEGLYENTLILFSSDNGPTYTGGADTPFFDSAQPFKTDEGWGKGSVQEGGIRVPMIASWPGQVPAGSTSDHVSAFYDVLATLLDAAGAPIPDNTDGVSFLAAMRGDSDAQPSREPLYWEFPEYGGQQAVRMGDWKGIRRDMQNGSLDLELYNLATDPREQADVADQHPDIVAQIETIMAEEHEPPANERFEIQALMDVRNDTR